MKPRLLDLFCGAGGASRGYADAGFEVVGVDLNPQPEYPFAFHQCDWSDFKRYFSRFDAIHASPPCQAYSTLRGLGKQSHLPHPELIVPVRRALRRSGLPYVIENVVGSPLLHPAVLCGQYFGLGVRRHRLFETNWSLPRIDCKPHHKPNPIGVYGDHPEKAKNKTINRAHTLAMGREAMGIDWMTWKTLTQAIPPAYTRYVGQHLFQHVMESR